MTEDNGDAWKTHRRSDGQAEDLSAFVRRWSQRKQAESRTPSPPAEAAPPVGPGASEAAAAEPPPDLETLSESSDVSAFLGPKVGEELRRLAFRKLFHMPKFNIRDGLDDYDDDYRAIGVVGSALGSAIHERVTGSARESLRSAGVSPGETDRRQSVEPRQPAASETDTEDEPDGGPASA